MPVPDSIKNKPQVPVGLEFVWRAFWELSTDRDLGMAEGPIPWTAMNDYAYRYGLMGDDFDYFVLLLKAMDSVYIEKRSDQQKNAMKSKGKGKGLKGGGKKSIKRGRL